MEERDFARFEFRTDILYCRAPKMLPTIGYGEFKDSLTLRVIGTEALSIMGIAVHTGRSANVTVPVTNWDKLLKSLEPWQRRIEAGCRKLCHVKLEQDFDGVAALPGLHLSLGCRGNLFSVGALTPSQFPVGCCCPTAEVWNWIFLLLDGLPSGVDEPHLPTIGPFYQHGFTLIPAWISNHMPSNMWDEITYPFLNFNGCTVEV